VTGSLGRTSTGPRTAMARGTSGPIRARLGMRMIGRRPRRGMIPRAAIQNYQHTVSLCPRSAPVVWLKSSRLDSAWTVLKPQMTARRCLCLLPRLILRPSPLDMTLDQGVSPQQRSEKPHLNTIAHRRLSGRYKRTDNACMINRQTGPETAGDL